MRRVALTAVFGCLLCSCTTVDSTPELSGLHRQAGLEASSAKPAVQYTRFDLGTLGGDVSYATDVSDANVVVGWSTTPEGANHAFRWTATDGMTDLGTLPGDQRSTAVAILNGAGRDGAEILGTSSGPAGSKVVVWSRSGDIRMLPIPTTGTPAAFNTAGDIVGTNSPLYTHAWYWSPRVGLYDLTANTPGGYGEGIGTAINSSGLATYWTTVGECQHMGACWRSYLWSERDGLQPLGLPSEDHDASVQASAVNDRGTVVGRAWTLFVTYTAFRWDRNSGFTMLPSTPAPPNTFPYPYANALGVNANGTAVGQDHGVASAWPPDGGVVHLSPDDPNTSIALAINASGTIVGWAVGEPGQVHATLWTQSPDAIASDLVPARPAAQRVGTSSDSCLNPAANLGSRAELFACLTEIGGRR